MNTNVDWIARVRARIALLAAAAMMLLAAWPVVARAQTVVQVPPVTVQVPARPIQVPLPTIQLPAMSIQVQRPLPLPDERQLEIAGQTLDALRPALDAAGQRLDAAMAAFDRANLDQALAELQALQGQGVPTRRLPTVVAPRGFVVSSQSDGTSSYEAGLSALDSEQWQSAVDRFDQVIKIGKNRVDGAMYWKAYALDKLGQRNDALETLQALEKSYPNSRYLDDARALQIEVKSSAGQPVKPEDQTTEDLKLMALSSVMQADPERGIPLLEQMIKGRNSLKVKQRALFLLSTSDSPKAREVLASIARGGVNPDLQLKAIRYLGTRARFTVIRNNAGANAGASENASANGQLLADIYAASKDNDVKREIIRSLMTARDLDRLLNIAKTEPSPELRIEAIRQLGIVRADNFRVYAIAAQAGVTVGQASLRAKVADDVGAADRAKTADALVQIYRAEKDQNVKKAIISALYSQQNAKALVDLARQESDPIMKKEIVSRLSTMKSKEATDYMLELLK